MIKRSQIFCVGAMILTACFLLHTSQAAVLQKDYDLVIASTNGDVSAAELALAIKQLYRWREEAPQNFRILFDLISLNDKAGDFSAAAILAQQIELSVAPNYVVSSAAHTFLKTGQFVEAEQAYQLLLTKTPDDRVWQAGLVYAWMGQHRSQESLNYLNQILNADINSRAPLQARDLPIVIALAEVHEQRREWLPAARRFQQALQINPDFRYAKRGLVFMLEQAGSSYLANYFAQCYRDVFSVEEQYKFAHADAALTIRYGKAQLASDRTPARFHTTDIALDENTALSQQYGVTDKARFDRIIALDDRAAMNEVIQLYQELLADKVEIPNYVKSSVADAYLYLQKPEAARDIYLDLIQHWDQSNPSGLFDIQAMLIDAYSDAGQYEQAEALAQQMVDHQTKRPSQDRNVSGAIDRGYLRAAIINANLQKNDDHLKLAQSQIVALRKYAPFNDEIRSSWASLLSSRDHPHTSLEEYTLMRIDHPDSMEAALGQAELLLSLDELNRSKALLPALIDSFPENKQVQNVAQRIANYEQPQYRIETTLGHGAVKGGADSISDVVVYTAPLSFMNKDGNLGESADWRSNHNRLFVRVDHASGDTVDGTSVTRTRAGAGLEYRDENWRAEVQFTHALNNITKNGLALALSSTLSDSWRIYASVDTNILDLPAAAMNEGVTAKQEKIGIDWSQNESRKAGAELSSTQFSDRNVRQAAYSWWMERWISEPVYKLDTVVGFSSSRNSLINRAYYNPSQDEELDLDVKGEWITWHRYQRSFRQRIDVSAGHYWERGYGSGATLGLRYEHEWRFENDFGFSYGVGRHYHPYDGTREFRTYLYFNLTGRF